ncbi:hypothetical protein FRC11_014052 [Ceratobasidium sp. 423]|nr:hypothetical protein FRC11_014052 [Ceratobasidium sp. 423]
MANDTMTQTSNNPLIGEEHGVVNDGGREANRVLDIYLTQEFLHASEPIDVWARAFSNSPVVRLVEREELAEVVLSVNAKNSTAFIFKNQLLVKYGAHIFPAGDHSIAPRVRNVMGALDLLSRWHWCLGLKPDSRPFEKAIDLEFYKLKFTGEYTDEGDPILEPDGPNINVDGVVDFVAGLEDCYGIRVVNRSTQDLYAYLLDFTTANLSIRQRRVPILDPISSSPMLPKDAPLTIGYGEGGQLPFMFAVSEGQNVDVDTFRLFVFTHPIDFPPLEQESIFDRPRGGPSFEIPMPVFEEASQWDVFTMTIVQRRYPKEEASASTQIPGDSLP